MFNRVVSAALASVLLCQATSLGVAQGTRPSDAALQVNTGDQVKEQVQKLGSGTRVKVLLRNRERLKGRIVSADDQAFTLKLRNGQKSETRKIEYAEVESVKRGNKWGALGSIGVAVGLPLIVVLVVASWALSR